MVLSDPLTALKGVGEVRAQQLQKLGIVTIQDLLCFFQKTTKIAPNFSP